MATQYRYLLWCGPANANKRLRGTALLGRNSPLYCLEADVSLLIKMAGILLRSFGGIIC